MHRYQECPPHPALAGHVACLWSSHAVPGGEPVRTRILPDNCIDILWQDRMPFGFVSGMMSRAHCFETSAPVLTVAVRFLPGAAGAFFDVPLHTLQDGHPALDELWPRAETDALATALWERERTLQQRWALIERALLARLRPGAPSDTERLVRTALRLIDASAGALRIEDLAGTLGVSRQHLALQFRERVGLNAKTFAMVRRFRQASAAVRGQPFDNIDWAGVASECGYYDQSHLIHAFQLFAGETPEAFARPRAHGARGAPSASSAPAARA